MDGCIRAPSAVIETALICKLHDRVGLGLNSRHTNASPCPSPLGHARHDRRHHRRAQIMPKKKHILTNKYSRKLWERSNSINRLAGWFKRTRKESTKKGTQTLVTLIKEAITLNSAMPKKVVVLRIIKTEQYIYVYQNRNL